MQHTSLPCFTTTDFLYPSRFQSSRFTDNDESLLPSRSISPIFFCSSSRISETENGENRGRRSLPPPSPSHRHPSLATTLSTLQKGSPSSTRPQSFLLLTLLLYVVIVHHLIYFLFLNLFFFYASLLSPSLLLLSYSASFFSYSFTSLYVFFFL